MELRKDEHVTERDALIAGAVEMKCNVLCKEQKRHNVKSENTVAIKWALLLQYWLNLSSHK